MCLPFRIIAEKSVTLKENLEERIAKIKGEYTLRVPILMYHHIGNPPVNEKSHQLYVHPDLFRREMEYLAENKYKSTSLDELADALKNKKKLPKKSIVITFDDGYDDFNNNAYPILKKYNLKSTIFISTNLVNKPCYLTLSSIKSLLTSKIVTIGSHTITHPNLTRINSNRLFYELTGSKRWIEKKLKTKITSFAYPFGGYNKNIIQEVYNTGYRSALTTEYGYLHHVNGLFSLKRIRLGNKILMTEFIRRVTIKSEKR